MTLGATATSLAEVLSYLKRNPRSARAEPYLRGEVRHALIDLRYAPELRFITRSA